jgi:hypothetical protein
MLHSGNLMDVSLAGFVQCPQAKGVLDVVLLQLVIREYIIIVVLQHNIRCQSIDIINIVCCSID